MKKLKIFLFASVLVVALTIPALAADSDNDGLDDLVETNTGIYIDQFDTGTDPLNHDTDGDGVMDGPEVNGGSHPLDPTITPSAWKTGGDTQVTDTQFGARYPVLTWNGSEYGMVWETPDPARYGINPIFPVFLPDIVDYGIYYSRFDSSGNKIGVDVKVTNALGQFKERPLTFIWTGAEYGLSWQDFRDDPDRACNDDYSAGDCNYEIYFARLDSSGAKLGNDLRITNDVGRSTNPSLVWSGSEYGISWWDLGSMLFGISEIMFGRISASGNKTGLDIKVRDGSLKGRASNPSLVWTGLEYGVSYERSDPLYPDSSGIYLSRIDSSGKKLDQGTQILGTGVYDQFLLWSGTEYVMNWLGNSDKSNPPATVDINFTRIDTTGNKIGSEIGVSKTSVLLNPSLVREGAGYSVLAMRYGGTDWMSDVFNRDIKWDIYLARIDGSGRKIGPDSIVTTVSNSLIEPSVVWTGSEYGMSWHDLMNGKYEVFFARIAVDEDGDGLSHADEVNVYGTDPYNYDTDGDGIPDALATPQGDNVSLDFGNMVSIKFTSITDPGATMVTTSQSGPPPGQGFRLGSPPVYYDIQTTANYSGPIEVCIAYDENQFSKPEWHLRLFHFGGNGGQNITTSHDMDANIICGEITSLSEFTVVYMDGVSKDRPTIRGACHIASGSTEGNKMSMLLGFILPIALAFITMRRATQPE